MLFKKTFYYGVSPQRYNELLKAYREVLEEKKKLKNTLMEVKTYLMRSGNLKPVVKYIDDVLNGGGLTSVKE